MLTGTGGKSSVVCCNARHEQALKEYKICSPPSLKPSQEFGRMTESSEIT